MVWPDDAIIAAAGVFYFVVLFRRIWQENTGRVKRKDAGTDGTRTESESPIEGT